jgi:hypothetical protein
MPDSSERVVVWAPRVLAILVAAFLSLFAADVFDEGAGLWETSVRLLVHLIPTWIVLALLFAAWRRAWIGAAVFPLLGALYLVLAWGRFHWSAYVVIAGPLFLLGLLYGAAWIHARRRRHTAT